MRNQVVLQLDPSARNSRNSEGSFITLKSGRIILAYTRYETDPRDEGPADIVARHSDDGGKTWSQRDRVVIPNFAKANVMSVSFLRLQSGRIAMYFAAKDSLHQCIPHQCFSDDEGKTFTKPQPVFHVPGYFVLNNDRVIQLSSGRLVMPLALHYMRGCKPGTGMRNMGMKFGQSGLICFYHSDDEGATWEEAGNRLHLGLPNDAGLQEPGVVELNDGTVWAWMRYWDDSRGMGLGGRQWQSFSRDKSQSWSVAEASQFVSPCSPMSIKRIPATGDLLAIWNDHSGRFPVGNISQAFSVRTPLVTAVSSDEGKTWNHHRAIEKSRQHGFCYTAIHFADDAVLLAYCAGGKDTGGNLRRLRVRRMKISELYR